MLRKPQIDLIKKGCFLGKSKEKIYQELCLFSEDKPCLSTPSFEEFEIKYFALEDYQDFYSPLELSQVLNTSVSTIKRWFRVYSKELAPIDGELVELKRLKRFIKQFPGELVDNCNPDLLWLISIF